LVGNTPVCRKRENEHSGQEKCTKLPKTLESDDGECDGVSFCPRVVDRALSASRILRGLNQPVAPPSEVEAYTVTLPFFKSPRRLSDNLCLFFSAYNVLDADERFAFCEGNTDYPEEAFLKWAHSNTYIQNRLQANGDLGYSYQDLREYLRHLVSLGYIKSYVWKNLSRWERIPTQLLCGEKLTKHTAVIIAGLAPSSDVRDSMLKGLQQHLSTLSLVLLSWKNVKHPSENITSCRKVSIGRLETRVNTLSVCVDLMNSHTSLTQVDDPP
jgi:hypothetical protein